MANAVLAEELHNYQHSALILENRNSALNMIYICKNPKIVNLQLSVVGVIVLQTVPKLKHST
jgi:hypothetical protein